MSRIASLPFVSIVALALAVANAGGCEQGDGGRRTDAASAVRTLQLGAYTTSQKVYAKVIISTFQKH